MSKKREENKKLYTKKRKGRSAGWKVESIDRGKNLIDQLIKRGIMGVES